MAQPLANRHQAAHHHAEDGLARRPERCGGLYARRGKRLLDIAVSVMLLLTLSPALALLAVVVRLSGPGPIVFRQTRVGRRGEPFTMFKFRTMIADRRGFQASIAFPDRRTRHKSEHDPRVTRVGRFLRRHSLDELPQLVNVLRGEMSLVGPRPELPHIVARYDEWQHRRHIVRPGLTGWWQVEGRGERPMHEHTELDLFYIARLSVGFDARILARTLWRVVSGTGAY